MNKIIASLLHTTKPSNSVINALSSHASHHEVLSAFRSMLRSNAAPNNSAFLSLLKACASLNLLPVGQSIHQQVIVNGFSADPYIGSSLINFYGKFGLIASARELFDETRDKDVVHWTAIIECYSRAGDVETAFSTFERMRFGGIKPTSVTLLGMLGGALEIEQVQCLHGCSVVYGFAVDVSVVNSMLTVYCKFGGIEEATYLFEQMDRRDIISWNSLISEYGQIGNVRDTLKLLCRMRNEGFLPDHQTFGAVVSSSGMEGDIDKGRVIHGQIVRGGYDTNTQVQTSLLAMYLKCQEVAPAVRVFRGIAHKDEVCWIAMISGLLKNVGAEEAMMIFSGMLKSELKPSSESIACAFAACAQLGTPKSGASVHGFVLRQGLKLDTTASNSLITMYAKCGCLKQSLAVFKRMDTRDLVSWNAIISGCAQNMDLPAALLLFTEMKCNTHQRPDSLTVVSLLQSCASMGAHREGKLMHNIVIRSCITPYILVETALVDMYSKCGQLGPAEKCFEAISRKDLIAWSTMISAYGFHGKGKTALRAFSEFLHSQMEPNDIIFLSVLSACNHSGLVHQGLNIFNSMVRDFGAKPKLEHLACIVDLLCRSGRVEEAYGFYNDHFSEPSVDVLGILLEACRANEKTELARIISNDIITLEPSNPQNYVQLARCFATMKRWDRMGDVRAQMRSRGLRKLPGWSFIDISGKITTFYTDHNSHPDFEEIVSVLKVLSTETRKVLPSVMDQPNCTTNS